MPSKIILLTLQISALTLFFAEILITLTALLFKLICIQGIVAHYLQVHIELSGKRQKENKNFNLKTVHNNPANDNKL
jgi:predicted membrane protein